MMDQKLAGKLNLSNIDILDYRIAANHLESAGDYIVDLANSLDLWRIIAIDEIVEAGILLEKMQEKSVAAFVNNNRSESNVVVKMYDKFTEFMNSLKSSAAYKASRVDCSGIESYILYGQDSTLAGLTLPIWLSRCISSHLSKMYNHNNWISSQ